MKAKKALYCYLAVSILSLFFIYYLRFAHGREWYATLLSSDLNAAGILTIILVLGWALWGFGRLIKAKKTVKAIIIGMGILNFIGSILALLTLCLSFFFPAARELIHFKV